MKNQQHKLSALKKKLRMLKEDGRKEVRWSLTKEQADYLIDQGYDISPEIYLIRTRRFNNSKNINSVLKDIHWSNLKGKKEIARKLKTSEVKLLEEYEIKYRPVKYIIIL